MLQTRIEVRWRSEPHVIVWSSCHSPSSAPTCPRPDFCNAAINLDQLVQRGLLHVLNYQQFPHFQYVPQDDTHRQQRKKKGVSRSQSPAPDFNRLEPVSQRTSPLASSSSFTHVAQNRKNLEEVETSAPRRAVDPRETSSSDFNLPFNGTLLYI